MNFDLIAWRLAVAPLLAALDAEPARWAEITARQEFAGSAHHDTETIFLRGPKPSADPQNQVDSMLMPSGAEPAIRDATDALLAALPFRIAELGRVMAVRLKPGGVIDAHTDEGAYAEHFSRFHIALRSTAGNKFRCGGESIYMRPGDCWWFNHRREHSVRNTSAQPRIHLIFDARVSSLYRKEA